MGLLEIQGHILSHQEAPVLPAKRTWRSESTASFEWRVIWTSSLGNNLELKLQSDCTDLVCSKLICAVKGTWRCRISPFISVFLGYTEVTDLKNCLSEPRGKIKGPFYVQNQQHRVKGITAFPRGPASRHCLLPYTLMPPPHDTC